MPTDELLVKKPRASMLAIIFAGFLVISLSITTWKFILPYYVLSLLIATAVIPMLYITALTFRTLVFEEDKYNKTLFSVISLATYMIVSIFGLAFLFSEIIYNYYGLSLISFVNDFIHAVGFGSIENSTARGENAAILLTSIFYMEFCKIFIKPWIFVDKVFYNIDIFHVYS